MCEGKEEEAEEEKDRDKIIGEMGSPEEVKEHDKDEKKSPNLPNSL